MSYQIRRLTAGAYVREFKQWRDPVGNAEAIAGAVCEVEAEELRLTSEEVVQGLEARRLRSTDLVMIGGTWTTLGESAPFFEIAEPYAKQEGRVRTVKGVLALLASAVPIAIYVFLRFYL